MKDGGPESRVWGYFLFEVKRLASVCLLHFKDGSREAFHTHAFNAISWVVKGKLTETEITGETRIFLPSLKPIYTPREMFHKVSSGKDSYVFTLRGPWVNEWKEFLPLENKYITLTNGRNQIDNNE